MDPFTEAYRTLRTALLADDDVAAFIATRNCPDLTSTTDRRPIKTNIQDADCPEMLLVPIGQMTTYTARTNTGHAVTRRYAIRVTAGEMVTHARLHPVEFALFKAFCKIKRTNNTLGLSYIEGVTLIDASTIETNIGDAQRGTLGWVTVFGVEIRFAFDDDTLQIHRGR